jgi:putative spermidine/putrescine transport system permease protein
MWLAVFYYFPVGSILSQSFADFGNGSIFTSTATDHGRLDNYRWFFSSGTNVAILERTITTALVVVVVCLLLGYPFAYLMTIVRPTWRVILLGVVLVPFWTSLMVRNYAWIVLLQTNGPVNDALSYIGVGRVQLLGSTRGVTIAMAQILMPFMVLPLYATLREIDRKLVFAAQSLGARPLIAFLRIYVPLSLPGVFAGALLVFVLALGFYVTPALVGSPQNSLLSQLIVTQLGAALAWGRAGAMAVVLLFTSGVLIAAAWLLTRRARLYETAND